MTRIAKLKIFEAPRSQNHEEAIETLNLALKEAKELLTPIELAQEILKVFRPSEVQKTLDDLRKGRYI